MLYFDTGRCKYDFDCVSILCVCLFILSCLFLYAFFVCVFFPNKLTRQTALFHKHIDVLIMRRIR